MSSEIHILTPEGILDNAKSLALRQEIKDLIDLQRKIFVIDFQKVSFMDSSGLGNLILIRRMIMEEDAQLFITALNDQVKMLLFELTNTAQFFEIAENVEQVKAIFES